MNNAELVKLYKSKGYKVVILSVVLEKNIVGKTVKTGWSVSLEKGDKSNSVIVEKMAEVEKALVELEKHFK